MRIPALNRVVALLLICLVTVASPLPAALTSSGNVEPSDLSLWHSNTHGYIGKTSDGSVLVDNGSSLVSNHGTLGYQLGAVGTATINGLGSKWTMANSLDVGRYGTGVLNIKAGGQVNNRFSYVGRYVGSSGAATVTGAGSKWTNTTILYIGFEGDGRLTVEDGGEVSTSTLFASLSDLYGDGSITAENGAVLDSDLVFDVSHGLQQNFAFGSAGQLSLSWTENGALGAGYKQNGSIVVRDGVEVISNVGYLGYQAGAKGMASIADSDSQWTIESTLFVGYSGEGSLTLESGGKLSTGNTILGLNPDSTGTIIVTGEGSHWTSSVISVGSTLPSGITSEDDGVGKLII
jgi:T5SS/PEP-CTERM-associated repeat protein